MSYFTKAANLFVLILLISGTSQAQFLDSFDKDKIDGWFFFTGDGNAEIDFIQKDGYASIFIDATKDKHNVYWTIIKRDVTKYLDLNKLKDTTYQLRVEAKVRVHDAPRRLNFMVNTNRTTNFHIDLMEYDIPDTNNWHVISMTTKKFDALPGDTVYVQLAATDYGLGKYSVDVDYYSADIVNINEAGTDKGVLVPYHPPVPEVNTFTNHLEASHDCLINLDFPDVNFNDWHINESVGKSNVLAINGNQWAILKWDFDKFKDSGINEAGLLELTTHSVYNGGNYIAAFGEDFGMEFGKIRVIEILGGNSEWDQEKVTYNNFMQGKKYHEVFNSQMLFDTEINEKKNGKTFITISKPVLQRMISGKTKGLLMRPLGAINASFFSSENGFDNCPKLYFNIK